jgi:hypothetical protein
MASYRKSEATRISFYGLVTMVSVSHGVHHAFGSFHSQRPHYRRAAALAPLLHVDSVSRLPGSVGRRMLGQRQEECSVSGHCGIGSTSKLLPRIACPVAAHQENDQGCNHIEV